MLYRQMRQRYTRELPMTRVTYGVAPSSYRSTRALQVSGKNDGSNPNTVNVILNDVWVDDLLGGSDTLEEACVLQDDLSGPLNKNCLPLRKWSSNEPQLVTHLPKDFQKADKAYEVNEKPHQIKTLRLNLSRITLCMNTGSSEYVSNITKPTFLSDVSKHFDPIDLIAPVPVVAKVIIQ